jgi:hypothetical protein
LDANEKRERYKVALEHARFEDDNFGRIYQGFLLPQTVFLGFVLAASAGKDSASYHALLAAASVLCIHWFEATRRNIKSVAFRLERAAVAEPAEWDVIKTTGRAFAEGREVKVGERFFQHDWLSRWLPPRLGVQLIVGLFVVAYLVLALAQLDMLGMGWLLRTDGRMG